MSLDTAFDDGRLVGPDMNRTAVVVVDLTTGASTRYGLAEGWQADVAWLVDDQVVALAYSSADCPDNACDTARPYRLLTVESGESPRWRDLGELKYAGSVQTSAPTGLVLFGPYSSTGWLLDLSDRSFTRFALEEGASPIYACGSSTHRPIIAISSLDPSAASSEGDPGALRFALLNDQASKVERTIDQPDADHWLRCSGPDPVMINSTTRHAFRFDRSEEQFVDHGSYVADLGERPDFLASATGVALYGPTAVQLVQNDAHGFHAALPPSLLEKLADGRPLQLAGPALQIITGIQTAPLVVEATL